MKDLLHLIIRGGYVRRFHTLPTITTDTVGHHSFMVAWVCFLLTSGEPSASLLLAALQHDLAEHVTGDLPAPSKRSLGIREQFATYEAEVLEAAGMQQEDLTSYEVRVLKLADIMAGMLHCTHERTLGNRVICEAYHRFNSYLNEHRPFSQTEQRLSELLDSRWGRADK